LPYISWKIGRKSVNQITPFISFRLCDGPYPIFWAATSTGWFIRIFQFCQYKNFLSKISVNLCFGCYLVIQTWADSLGIHNDEISGFFCLSDFTWNQFWSFLSLKNCHFDHLSCFELWIFVTFWHCQVWNFSKNQSSLPAKL